MCFYYALSYQAQTVAHRYQKLSPTLDAEFTRHWQKGIFLANGFEHPRMPVVYRLQGQPRVALFTWGLIPAWVKEEQQARQLANKTLNARIETLHYRASFKDSVSNKRCLIPASGFFEWQHRSGKKIPFFISSPQYPLFSLAGLWAEWQHPLTGQRVFTFTIVTVPASPLLARLHNNRQRMPLILQPQQEEAWLNNHRLADFAPLADRYLSAYPVAPFLKSGLDPTDPDIIKPTDKPLALS